MTGKLLGRAGSFVLQHEGTFSDGLARSSYFVVPGSGTGALARLSGEGRSEVGGAAPHPFPLDIALDEK